MFNTAALVEVPESVHGLAHQASAASLLPAILGQDTSGQLSRMFRDPRILEEKERKNLIVQLRSALEAMPQVVEVRVLYGMALCVDLQAQEALVQLQQATEQSPDCFIARLKYGELLMRLRICDKAEEQTHQAALLASNAAQSEMARRQATTIRTMQREGIERGGYKGLLGRMFRTRRNHSNVEIVPSLSAIE